MFSKLGKTVSFVGLALAASCLATPASAATFVFNFTGSGSAGGYVANGTLVTEDVPNADGGLLITGISGDINTVAITGLIPPGGFAFNDNLLFPDDDLLLSNQGFSFVAGGTTSLNIFTLSGGTGYGLLGLATGSFSITRVGDPAVPAVPEPGTWALMLLGFGFIGAAMRRQRRTKVTVSYA